MLNAPKAARSCVGALARVSVRYMGDDAAGPAPGKYESAIVTNEIEYRRRRRVREMIAAEKRHVASLPGISSDEYKPSLEPGTINLRSMHPPYHSQVLRDQPREETEAALAKAAEWRAAVRSAKGTDRTSLLQDLLSEFRLVYVTDGDPLYDPKYVWSQCSTNCLKHHGIARGITGYMVLDLEEDEELQDDLVRLAGDTWMPHLWAGGKFVGGWRDIVRKHNSGVLVDVLASVGIRSRLKGCYYEGKSPLVLH